MMEHGLTAQDIDRYERISNLLLQGVSNEQIGIVVGLSEGELISLIDKEEFKQVQGKCLGDSIEENKTVNDGWNSVEEQSLSGLLEVMKYKKDPDFLLKAALTANRATRRNLGGTKHRDPLEAANAGARVVINLQANFVQGLAELRTNRRDLSQLSDGQKKQVNMLGTADVERVLNEPRIIDIDSITVNDLVGVKSATR